MQKSQSLNKQSLTHHFPLFPNQQSFQQQSRPLLSQPYNNNQPDIGLNENWHFPHEPRDIHFSKGLSR